jgi:hypothetical protein
MSDWSVKKGKWFIVFERSLYGYHTFYVKSITEQTITLERRYPYLVIAPEEHLEFPNHWRMRNSYDPTHVSEHVYVRPPTTNKYKLYTTKRQVYFNLDVGMDSVIKQGISLKNNPNILMFDSYDEIRKVTQWRPAEPIKRNIAIINRNKLLKKAKKVVKCLVKTQIPVELKHMIAQWL